jgi:hypothetical protein
MDFDHAGQTYCEDGPAPREAFWGDLGDLRALCSEWAAAAAPFSHQPDDFGAKLCCVKIGLAARKPDDDFGGLFAVGVGPQIKIDNDLVKNFQEEHDRLRIEDSSHAAKRHNRASKWKRRGMVAQVGNERPRPKHRRQV